MPDFKITSDFKLTGDQPQAVDKLTEGLNLNYKNQTWTPKWLHEII